MNFQNTLLNVLCGFLEVLKNKIMSKCLLLLLFVSLYLSLSLQTLYQLYTDFITTLYQFIQTWYKLILYKFYKNCNPT